MSMSLCSIKILHTARLFPRSAVPVSPVCSVGMTASSAEPGPELWACVLCGSVRYLGLSGAWVCVWMFGVEGLASFVKLPPGREGTGRETRRWRERRGGEGRREDLRRGVRKEERELEKRRKQKRHEICR